MYIGAFLNFDAITKKLIEESKDVVLFCAGWKDIPNSEDSLFAGMVINSLEKLGFKTKDDASILCRDFYKFNQKDIYKVIFESAHANRLKLLTEIEQDLKYASTMNLTTIVPKYINGIITKS